MKLKVERKLVANVQYLVFKELPTTPTSLVTNVVIDVHDDLLLPQQLWLLVKNAA